MSDSENRESDSEEELESYYSPTALQEEQKLEEEKRLQKIREEELEREKNKLSPEQIEEKIKSLKEDFKNSFVKSKNVKNK